jgi:hypothetical protein
VKRRDFCSVTLLGGALALPRLGSAADEVAGDIAAVRLSGAATAIRKKELAEFARGFRGALILPANVEYEQARRVWNPMHDRRPALIARCADAQDVSRAVKFARQHDLLVAVRGGGHSFPGHSTCDGGLMIDLSALREVRVDAARRTAVVAPGAWVSDVDTATGKLGLATTMGQISDTGVAGLTLGGGYGWLSRRLGLACDNLLSADLVTADGELRRVGATDHPDLYWAIRGGGGNFGVATSFEYRLHEQSPRVYAAYIAYPFAHLREVLELFQETTARGPRELSLDLSIEAADDGSPLVAVYGCHCGDPAQGPALLAPFERVAKPHQSVHGPDTYERVQHQSDGPHLSRSFHYLKAGLIAEFTPGLIEVLRGFMPSRETFVYMQNASGAVGDIAPAATAYWNRKAMVNLMVMGSWPNAVDTDRIRAAIRATWEKIEPFSAGFYSNLSDADPSRTGRNYGENYTRLTALKRKYDPDNRFRLNSNIPPQGRGV